MANLISIATSVPEYKHPQSEIFQFMQQAYQLDDTEKRKLSFLYKKSGIDNRYSVIQDFNMDAIRKSNTSPWFKKDLLIDARMKLYQEEALPLSMNGINDCLDGINDPNVITHLITVSCTGMSAPGLDLAIMEQMKLNPSIFRTSVNFMGCYAAIHALKIGKMICDTDKNAVVLIVATELCTLHFQQTYSEDNAASSLLFGDGCAALLLSDDEKYLPLASIDGFSSTVVLKGKKDMSWELSKNGFLMTLSGYVPALIKEDISVFVYEALKKIGVNISEIGHWCIHPGGKKILDNIEQKLELDKNALLESRKILKNYGNMSSPTILFVLKEIIENAKNKPDAGNKIFGVSFGPGLTMETFIGSLK